MRDLPPLTAIRAFEAAARLSSFSHAADELHVTPTAISHQVRNLEDRLGVRLFIRHPGPVRLTEAGRRLAPAIRDALDRIANAVREVTPDEGTGPLILTTTRAFASRWLIPRLGTLQQAKGLPRLAVDASESVVDLRRGHADLAIRYARQAPPGHISRWLFSDRYAVVCAPSILDGPGNIEALQRLPLIHFDWKQPDREAPTWAQWIERARARYPGATLPDPDTGPRFSEESHAIEATLMGQGIALLSDRIVERELRNGSLVQVVDLTINGLAFYAAYVEGHPKTPDIRKVIEALATNPQPTVEPRE